eukprot:CAMPEP_0175166770 /NCGR_PEP_ID=MMETSP0087-20121206/27912_1 /TAXON_ID=136419 /ORGANISM="Unknown Unknown, Strain D1" /LENGTH=96 /DNA_ID=CAMNT_0016456467 /DNA_START=109 /DNA_END=399 /DNA_ORIENTATION=-
MWVVLVQKLDLRRVAADSNNSSLACVVCERQAAEGGGGSWVSTCQSDTVLVYVDEVLQCYGLTRRCGGWVGKVWCVIHAWHLERDESHISLQSISY